MIKSYLEKLVDERLDGNKSRMVELFSEDAILSDLNQHATNCDWYFFECKTYDGEYLVKDGSRYLRYYQEKGRVCSMEEFHSLKSAAEHMFGGLV